jgi:hypothetical protein
MILVGDRGPEARKEGSQVQAAVTPRRAWITNAKLIAR